MQIVRPSAGCLQQALKLLAEHQTELLDPEQSRVLCALIDGKLVAAIQWQSCAGGIVSMTPPVMDRRILSDNEQQHAQTSENIAARLAIEAVRQIALPPGVLLQCLVHPADDTARTALLSAGLDDLTDVDFMVCQLDRIDPAVLELLGAADPHDDSVSVIPTTFAEGAKPSRFIELIRRTYDGSLDCPSLAQVRSAELNWQVHSGATGFRPDLWTLYSTSDSDVAVLLVNDGERGDSMRIVYIGVVSSWRGKRLGTRILSQRLCELRDRGVRSVELVVDVANDSARRVYERLGFAPVARRCVFARWR